MKQKFFSVFNNKILSLQKIKTITTIELSQSITEKQYLKVVELLKEIGISVKTHDTKLIKMRNDF